MAASAPAGALVEATGIPGRRVLTGWAHKSCGSAGMAVEVALEAQCRIALGEHLLVHRSVRIVAA